MSYSGRLSPGGGGERGSGTAGGKSTSDMVPIFYTDVAALSLRNMVFGIGRLYFLSREDTSWQASSLASLGVQIGPSGQRPLRASPGLKKEFIEFAHALRGRGVSKLGQVLLGLEVARKGGELKRGLGLSALVSPAKKAKTGDAEAASSPHDTPAASSPDVPDATPTKRLKVVHGAPGERGELDTHNANKMERHYAWNSRGRLALTPPERRLAFSGVESG